jgi:hypothetical protein
MPSHSLGKWRTDRVARLDEIENAHRSVGGVLRGRRYATLQINYAYTVLIASQFQGYCRDLHSECVTHLISKVEVPGIPPGDLRIVMREYFVPHRKLDSGNAGPGSLGDDFKRFGIDFWVKVKALDTRNVSRLTSLSWLIACRNAIAHQDFRPLKIEGRTHPFPVYLTLTEIRKWRKAREKLAVDFDVVMSTHIGALIGTPPW